MWLTFNKGLLPDYLVEVPLKIRRMLVYRFLCATLYCICLEFGVLAVFLFSVIIPMKRNPTTWIRYVIKWSFFSMYTWTLILPHLFGIGLYGLLLCRMHNIRPECHHVHFDRLKHNFLNKFCLMCTTVSLSCYTSWLYGSYIMSQPTRSEQLMMKRAHVNGNLMAFGKLCGLCYFLTQYASSSFKGFDLPTVRCAISVRLRQISRSTLQEAVKTTLISTTVFGLFFCVPAQDIFYHSWCLGMTISIQLHLTRCIYGLVWQARLPLTLHSFNPYSANIPMHEILLKRLKVWIYHGLMLPVSFEDVKDVETSRQLPICMALDCAVLHGFQMQAAIEFCTTINNRKMMKQLFEVDRTIGCRSWRALRNIVLGKVNDFRYELATCLRQCQSKGHAKGHAPPVHTPPVQTRPPRQMRSMIRPPPKTLCNPAKPRPKFTKPAKYVKYAKYAKYIANLIQKHWLYVKIRAFWHRFSGKHNSLAELNRILISAESLGYALQGIAAICTGSMKTNDRCVVWDEDVKRILKTVFELTGELDAIEYHKILQQSGELCSSYRLLRLTVRRSLYHLLSEYRDCLEVLLVDDWHLFRELEPLLNNLDSI